MMVGCPRVTNTPTVLAINPAPAPIAAPGPQAAAAPMAAPVAVVATIAPASRPLEVGPVMLVNSVWIGICWPSASVSEFRDICKCETPDTRPAFLASTTCPPRGSPRRETTSPSATRGRERVALNPSPALFLSEDRNWSTRTVTKVPAGSVIWSGTAGGAGSACGAGASGSAGCGGGEENRCHPGVVGGAAGGASGGGFCGASAAGSCANATIDMANKLSTL